MAADREPEPELELRFAWDWFQYHAGQRLTAFNFFLILTSAAIVGYANAVASHSAGLGAAVALIGAIVALGFLAMDVRNAELVEYGRRALDKLEEDLPRLEIRSGDRGRKELQAALSGSRLEKWLYDWANKGQHRQTWFRTVLTHSFWLRLIMAIIGLAFLAAGVWAATGFSG